jgi:Zn-finger in ubiquitin-hydrolases and other protein
VSATLDPHLSMVRPVAPRTHDGCEECLQLGAAWVQLRLCLTCGHVGCCDSSPLRHARGHAYAVGHPIVQSFEPGEDWRWQPPPTPDCPRPPTHTGRIRG